jgi:hypothetical protein
VLEVSMSVVDEIRASSLPDKPGSELGAVSWEVKRRQLLNKIWCLENNKNAYKPMPYYISDQI